MRLRKRPMSTAGSYEIKSSLADRIECIACFNCEIQRLGFRRTLADTDILPTFVKVSSRNQVTGYLFPFIMMLFASINNNASHISNAKLALE